MRMRFVVAFIAIGLSGVSSGLEQSYEIQNMAISVVKVMAFRDVADKLHNTCPELPVADLKTRAEINQAVLERSGITADDFVVRADLSTYIDTGRRQLERDVLKLLAGCDLATYGELFDQFQWAYRSAYNELDLQMEFQQKIPLATSTKRQEPKSRHQQLMEESKYIVIAKVTPLSSVPKWYRDRYVSGSYRHNVVFKILEGWKEAKPLYVGIHDYLYSKDMIADTDTRWLLYVNESNEILMAVPEEGAREQLAALGPTKYFVSRNGDVVVKGQR